MEHTLCLSDDELADLTRKSRPSAQIRALNSMGIEYRRRPDGSVAVLRVSVLSAFGVKLSRAELRRKAPTGPDWEALEPYVKRFEINWDD